MGNIAIFILMFILGIIVGVAILLVSLFIKKKKEESTALSIIDKAKKDADKIKRDSIFETKEEVHKLKLEADKDIKEKKNEVKEMEERLLQRESSIDRRSESLQDREKNLDDREKNLLKKQDEIQESKDKLEEIKRQQLEELERISGYSREQAKKEVMKTVEDKMAVEIATYIKEKETEAKLDVDSKAKSLLINSMEKYAADVTNEQTVSVITLPNDEMKGRIIGREGRNIRTIEAITGVDLIIDDTPEVIVLSSFDPLRREIAKVTIETLIKDGRIHPARIEESVEKAKEELENIIKEEG